MYSLLRTLLFQLDAEKAHYVSLNALHIAYKCGLLRFFASSIIKGKPVAVMGIQFPNALGLAAGLDKNGRYIDALAALGFGFIEIGTVTPRPQPGNPKPRLFRIPKAQAIINRMGFNNDGVAQLIRNVQNARFRGVLGINIGKNFDTPIEHAADDYLSCLTAVYPYASYVTVNISSPNTQNLRELQSAAALSDLLEKLKTKQARLAEQYGRYVPIALKIAPDLNDEQLTDIARLLKQHHFDAVIATNTTVSRRGVSEFPCGNETGGLSGAPVRQAATRIVTRLAALLGNEVAIIGVGGIMTGPHVIEKINAGASLVQIYSGLIYRGPQLIRECLQSLK